MKSLSTKTVKKEVVVIGGGFAGINLIKHLAEDSRYAITLVDRNNYNFFIPLIYQVATGFLEVSSISYPFRKLLRRLSTVRFRLGTLIRVVPESHTIYLDNGMLRYDYLVFATGSETNYFNNENAKRNAIPMKTLHDALNMRNRLLQTMERACITEDPVAKRKMLTIVVAGGGPTGVEVAGVIAELRKNIVKKDYPELSDAMGDIYIIDGGPRLLAQMSQKSHRQAFNALRKLGVKVILNVFVKDFVSDQVILSNGAVIEAKSLIWAAGVIAKTFDGIPKSSIGHSNRMLVDGFNRLKNATDIYAIGDVCLQKNDPAYPQGHPQLAQVAMQQGKNLARNFSAMADGKALDIFRYQDKGTMAIIGRNRAVADLTRPKMHIGGFTALFIWLFIHLNSLINYRNKLKTLFNWIGAYLTKDESLRMIIRPEYKASSEQLKLPGANNYDKPPQNRAIKTVRNAILSR